jgi:hypothetical protein
MDFFFSEFQGGAELNAETLANSLKQNGAEIELINSSRVTIEFMQQRINDVFVFGNFVLLSEESKNFAINNLTYLIYEQDHKYLKTRNPIFFPNFKAPKHMLCNIDFFKGAKKNLFLTKLSKDVFVDNTGLDNVHNLGCSIWSKKDLNVMRQLCNSEKVDKVAVLDSDNPIKKRAKTVEYCEKNNLSFELIKDKNYHKFLEKLSRYKKFIFFTGHLETCARILVEAKMLNVEVSYQKKLIGAASEPWFKLSGLELIDEVEKICEEMPIKVMEIANE